MSHSVNRAKSKNEQFRMVVPADLRATVGKSAWTESLGTPDPLLTAEKRGTLIAQHKALVRELRRVRTR